MRRTIPEDIDTYTARPYERAEPKSPPLLDITLTIKCITPVFGGGVRAREPDMVDVVRVPGIRGNLRFWWRAVGHESTVEELFKNETAVWGGVSGLEGKATVSRVRVSVESAEGKSPFAAGRHDEILNKHGEKNLRSLPTWNSILGTELGYCLFSLQRTREELHGHYAESRAPMATHKVRQSVEFRLGLTVAAATATGDVVPRLLWSLWAWIHFGGIGGRTTRGFGALSLTKIDGLPEREVSTWGPRFEKPEAASAQAWLLGMMEKMREELRSVAGAEAEGQHGRVNWTHLRGARIEVGKPVEQATDAHRGLVRRLFEFRQLPGFARAGSPGESYWPEPDMLRLLVKAHRQHQTWEHPPTVDSSILDIGAAESNDSHGREWIPPRAAFGLPIAVQFKNAKDSTADADLTVGAEKGRWMSPLRLRPMACKDDKWVPVALLLTARPWLSGGGPITVASKSIHFSGVVRLAPGKSAIEPGGPVKTWFDKGGRDAACGFMEWLAAKAPLEDDDPLIGGTSSSGARSSRPSGNRGSHSGRNRR